MTEKTLVYIGRFSPFHDGHKAVVDWALSQNPAHLLIVIGSANAARSIRTPFTAEERERMIRACYPLDTRIDIAYLEDSPYDQYDWEARLDDILSDYEGTEISVIEGRPDEMKFLNLEVGRVSAPVVPDASGTEIRRAFFDEYNIDKQPVPQAVREYLYQKFPDEAYEAITRQWDAVEIYRNLNNKNQYPAAIFCADAVVLWRHYVLLVTRKDNGLLALPGGHVGVYEEALAAARRELLEETGLDLDDESPLFDQCFSSPHRDARGRCVTQAFLFDLEVEKEEPPAVTGGDDASEAKWYAIDDLDPSKVYADHIHIIREMTGCR